MADRPRVTVSRTGTPSRPWEARCSACTKEHIHTHPVVGAVAVNTRGMGNRLWELARLAAWLHLERCHPQDTDSGA